MKRHYLKKPKKLDLHRETLHRLDGVQGGLRVGGTLTVEPPCADTDACPPPTGCTSTLSCTQ